MLQFKEEETRIFPLLASSDPLLFQFVEYIFNCQVLSLYFSGKCHLKIMSYGASTSIPSFFNYSLIKD